MIFNLTVHIEDLKFQVDGKTALAILKGMTLMATKALEDSFRERERENE